MKATMLFLWPAFRRDCFKRINRRKQTAIKPRHIGYNTTKESIPDPVVHNRDRLCFFAKILIEHTPKHHLRKLPQPQKKT